MTFAHFEQLPDSPGGRYELRHGELVQVPPPKHRYKLIQNRLRALESAAGNAGTVETEVGFRALPEHEYRIADVAFVEQGRWDRIPPDGYLEGAPELVIEVLSPSNTFAEIVDKEKLCLENGSREFWVVDPDRRQVKVSTPGGHTVTYKAGDEIPLLLGGVLPVAPIFG